MSLAFEFYCGIIGVFTFIFIWVFVLFDVSISLLSFILKFWIFFLILISLMFLILRASLIILFNFIHRFLCFFLKLSEFFEEIYDCSFRFCVLEFLKVIVIDKYFYRINRFWQRSIGLTLNVVGILAMWPGMSASFVRSDSVIDQKFGAKDARVSSS